MPTRLPAKRLVLPFAAAVNRPWLAEAFASFQLAIMLGLLWLGLFGGGELVFGALAATVTILLSRSVAPLQLTRLSAVGLVRFLVHFIVQSVIGGFDVARRALHPACPLTPGWWCYRVRLPPGQGRMLFVGAIGLIPGTVGQTLQGDELWVHSIAGDPQNQLTMLERRVAGLYGITLASEGE